MHLLEEKIGSEVNSTKKRNKIEWILQMYVHVLLRTITLKFVPV